MKKKANLSKSTADYAGMSKEELLLEIVRLENRIHVLEYSDTNYRPEVKVEIDPSILVANPILFSEILGQIDEVVYFVRLNEDGTRALRFLSRRTEEILGINYENYINNPTGLIDQIHPDDLPFIYAAAKKLREGKTAQTFCYRYKHPVKLSLIHI